MRRENGFRKTSIGCFSDFTSGARLTDPLGVNKPRGPTRWPFNPAGPTILNFTPLTWWMGTVKVRLCITRSSAH